MENEAMTPESPENIPLSEWTTRRIVETFETYPEEYPEALVTEAMNRREEIVPELIGVLKKTLESPKEYSENYNYSGHVYAVYLLGHFREVPAHDLIADLFSLPGDVVDELFGGIITQDLPMILYRTAGGSFDRVKSMVLDWNAYRYCRDAAAQTLVYAVADGVLSREEAISFFTEHFREIDTHEDDDYWSMVSSTILDLRPVELLPVIRAAYEAERIDPFYVGFDEFQEALEGDPEVLMERLRKEMENRDLDELHRCLGPSAYVPPAPPRTGPLVSEVQAAIDKDRKKKKKKRKSAKVSRKKNRKK